MPKPGTDDHRGAEHGLGGGLETRFRPVGLLAGRLGAGNRGNEVGVHPADAVVVPVGDQEVAVGRDAQAVRTGELGGAREAAVAGEAAVPVPAKFRIEPSGRTSSTRLPP